MRLISFLIPIEDQHLLVRLHDVRFRLQLQVLRFDAREENVYMVQRLIFVHLVVSNSGNDSVHVLEIHCD